MAKGSRRKYSAASKAKVALAAMAGEKSLAELAEQFNTHPNQITNWKGQLSERAATALDGGNSPEPKVNLRAMHANARMWRDQLNRTGCRL